jgi:hypothetical protein
VDDVTDLRARLTYASLEDDELVRRLRQAQRAAVRADRRGRTPEDRVIDVREVVGAKVTRPWPTPQPPVTSRHRSSEWSVDDPSYYLG